VHLLIEFAAKRRTSLATGPDFYLRKQSVFFFLSQTKPFDQLEYISSALIIEKAHYLLCTLLSQPSSAGEEAPSHQPQTSGFKGRELGYIYISPRLKCYYGEPIVPNLSTYSHRSLIYNTGAERRILPPHVNFVIIKEE
jgi:hypothetical protein